MKRRIGGWGLKVESPQLPPLITCDSSRVTGCVLNMCIVLFMQLDLPELSSKICMFLNISNEYGLPRSKAPAKGIQDEHEV